MRGENAFHTSLQRVRWIWDTQMATYSVFLSTLLTFFSSMHARSRASLCLYPEAWGQTTPRFTGLNFPLQLRTEDSLPPSLRGLFLKPPIMLHFHQRERHVKFDTAGSLLAVGTYRRKSGGLWELVEIYFSSSVQRVFVVAVPNGVLCVCVHAPVCLLCLQRCQCPPANTSHDKLPTNTREYLRLQLSHCKCL